MMNKKRLYYTIAGILFTSILGTLWHFFYKWSGNSFFVGLITPVNESTWEHMKLLFFPMLIYSIFEGIQLRNAYPSVWYANGVGILAGTCSIPVLFYTYSGILGRNILWLDISTFILSVIIGFVCSYVLMTKYNGKKCSLLLYGVLLLFLIDFVVFTINPPKLGIFLPPC